ncbi:MAG TPA: response regulator [Burkholderiales bacterium]
MEIIIVDDELVSLTVLTQLVAKLPNCHVRAFSQPSAALAWCMPNEPDVVIVDYMMPDLNGIEFTRRLCALKGRAETPLMMVSASADRTVRVSALQNGFNNFMTKPFDFTELQSRVTDMLFLRSSQKQLVRRAFLLTGDPFHPAVDQAPAQRVLNVEMTLSRLAGDENLLADVAQIFLRTVPQMVASFNAALLSSDMEHAYSQAHSLKGAVAPFEAPDVFNAVIAVETHARNRDPAATASAFAVAERLVERLLEELAQMAIRTVGPEPQA